MWKMRWFGKKEPVVKEISLENKVDILEKLGINNEEYISGDKKPIGEGVVKVFEYLKDCVKGIKDADNLPITERNKQISKDTIISKSGLKPDISDTVLEIYENKRIIYDCGIQNIYSIPIKGVKDL